MLTCGSGLRARLTVLPAFQLLPGLEAAYKNGTVLFVHVVNGTVLGCIAAGTADDESAVSDSDGDGADLQDVAF